MLAEEVLDKHQDRLDKLCIVLPNKRSGLFLKENLARLISTPIFSPEYLSIEDFIERISGNRIIDNIHQTFILYEVHRQLEGDKADSLQDFLSWSPVLLSDLNDIDAYMVPAGELFGFLTEAKAINVWNPGGEPLSEFQKKYLAFFRSLIRYYHAFREMLKKDHLAYQGMARREAAENIHKLTKNLAWEKVVFAGFNALTPSEKIITDHLSAESIAEIFWDADAYYLNDPAQEAGLFMRQFRKQSKQGAFKWAFDHLTANPKDIRIIGTPSKSNQAKVAGKVLQEWGETHKQGAGKMDAVILPDEQLLIPVLNSIPGNVGNFNVTMGYPFRFTPAFSFFDAWINMIERAGYFMVQAQQENPVYHKNDVLILLQHTYSHALSNGGQARKISEELLTGNRFYFTPPELKSLAGPENENNSWLDMLFDLPGSFPELAAKIKAMVESLRDRLILQNRDNPDAPKDLDIEYLFHLNKYINKIWPYLNDEEFNLKTFHSLFYKVIGFSTIPFYGEPLRGLQVMGMLESRTLDFERVVVLSANEGILPEGKSQHSFIPYDIRSRFHLPARKEKNALFAHHFYHLLQRTKEAVFIYHTEPDEAGSGEKSRFLTQLETELPNANPRINIRHELAVFPVTGRSTYGQIEIAKTPQILKTLANVLENGLSPSSLATYIHCSLQFYFTYILGIKEREEVTESMDAALLGSLVHKSLNTLYAPYLGRSPESRIPEQRIKQALDQALHDIYPGGDVRYGKNLLIYHVALNLIKNALRFESSLTKEPGMEKRQIYALEKFYRRRMHINGKEVLFKGGIDRIDKIGDSYRIIDYKTGNVVPRTLNVKDTDALFEDPRKSKALQLLLYAWIFRGTEPRHPVTACNLSLRKISQGLVPLVVEGSRDIGQQLTDRTGEGLAGTVRDMLDPSGTFFQTSDVARCAWCNFKDICNR